MMIFNSLYFDLIFFILTVCVFVPAWVFFLLGWQLFGSAMISCQEGENNTVELVWTIVPTFVVGWLCFFNCQCLENGDLFLPGNVIKVVGNQWYWGYESSMDGAYDSMMGSFLGTVDKPLRLVFSEMHRILVTSADVIHSFVLPELSAKIDAIPGRINQLGLCPDRIGIFVGYCSELCGAGHAYMPIVVEVVPTEVV